MFAGLMATLGPWEERPRIAVAVSGGADSMALALLAHEWAEAQSGRLIALTVDHGLRAESAGEAAQVGAWLARRGISHRILRWEGMKPSSGIQAKARAARHALLAQACEAECVLHLLLAHHRGDQAETVLIRREDRSGPLGLAGMAAERFTPWGRLVRPLLSVDKPRLIATLRAQGQSWIEDPTNEDVRFARIRHRRRLAGEEEAAERLVAEARTNGEERARFERRLAHLLLGAVRALPEGYLWLDPAALRDAPRPLAIAALQRALRIVGARPLPPRGERVLRLWEAVTDNRLGAGRTLAGCRLIARGARVLVIREAERADEEVPLGPGVHLWDRRFTVAQGATGGGGLRLERAGSGPKLPLPEGFPVPARASLPAVHDLDGIVTVPHFSWVRPGFPAHACPSAIRFTPPQALTEPEFRVASRGPRVI